MKPLALVCLAAALILTACSKETPEATAAPANSGETPEAATTELAAPESSAEPNGAESVAGLNEATNTAPEAIHQAYIQQRVAELSDLADERDASALQSILQELGNREPAIRLAAIEAAIQFGDRAAIPKLKEAAAQTDSAQERVALDEAVEYLELPSLTEYLQAKRGGSAPKSTALRAKTR